MNRNSPLLTFAICIPTYKRPHLLSLLLQDIANQSAKPTIVIVVDGDPSSGEVNTILDEKFDGEFQQLIYVPSNHSNLAYQRYIGWRIAQDNSVDFLLYFDDDLRIHKMDAISNLLEPMAADQTVVGVTSYTSNGEIGELTKQPILVEKRNQHGVAQKIVSLLGPSRNLPPGGLSPTGNRRLPIRKENCFLEVQWLQGRVMLYRMSALTQDCFSDDLFALDHIRCDLGEDTYLSRQVGSRGKLLIGFGLGIEHPNADLPKCYPIESYKLGYARAYSRRFLNDHYRVVFPPKISDRLSLITSYLGNSVLNWLLALKTRQTHHYSYAKGYTKGALRGIFQQPTAKNLTPHICWWRDAEDAIQGVVHFRSKERP